MKKNRKLAVLMGGLAAALTFNVASVLALTVYGPVSAWPKSWPGEFNDYLDDALHVNPPSLLMREIRYDIHFDEREAFERLWPAVLKVVTDGAPLTLRAFKPNDGPSALDRFYSKPYLSISVPPTIAIPQSMPPSLLPRKLEIVRLPSGEPTEYVRWQDEGWRPFEPKRPKNTEELKQQLDRGPGIRARTEVTLYVDGNVIDLNRIPLPDHVPIVNERELDR
jgi:hypothetical protein